MNPLSSEEYIELGLSIPTNSLEVWATVLLAAAQWKLDRLELRGITPSFLKEIKTLIQAVGDLENTLGKEKHSHPPEADQVQRIREAAATYQDQANQILSLVSGTLSETPLEVRTGPLLGNLGRDMACIVALLRGSSAKSGSPGIDKAFLSEGDVLVRELKESQMLLTSARQALSPAQEKQCSQKGKLYERIWTLIQVGQREFLHEPEQAATFNYSLLNRALRAGSHA